MTSALVVREATMPADGLVEAEGVGKTTHYILT